MKERFGRPKGPSREDIEREAEKELARLTRNAPSPSMGGGLSGGGVSGGTFGGPAGEMATPLDEIASSVRSGRPSAPNLGVLDTIGGGPGGYKSGAGEFDRGLGGYGGPSARRGGATGEGPAPGLPADFEDPEEERATITELALRDLAARDGTDPEDLVIHQDPGMAEAMRDEAMRRFFDRQQTRQPVETAPIDPANTVLGRLAARRKAEEEGRTLDDDAPSAGGLLDRVRQREEAKAAESRSPAGGRPASVGRLQDRQGSKGAYEVDDDDDYDGSQGLRARVTARRRSEIDADDRSGRVFAMPSADEAVPVPELAAMATRLSRARGRAPRPGTKTAGTKKRAKPTTRSASATKSAPTMAKTAVAGRAAAPKAASSKAASKKAASKKAASARAVTVRTSAKKAAGSKAAGRTAGAPEARRAAGATKAKPVGSSTGRASGTAPVDKNDVPATRPTTKRTTKPAKATAKKAARRR